MSKVICVQSFDSERFPEYKKENSINAITNYYINIRSSDNNSFT